MRKWSRIWASCSMAVLWLLSNIGIVLANGNELSRVVIPRTASNISPESPLYLTPYNASSILDGMGQQKVEERGHYSHRSHSSHYSHSSHSSHYSGYGYGSGSGSVSTTSPVIVDKMAIRTIQKKLNDLGYDAGPVDGVKGEKTIEAIKSFQTNFNLEADGIVGDKTKQILESISLVEIQRKLNQLGYNCNAYGTRDDNTIEAIKDFQQKNGLAPNGIIGEQTKSALGI